MSKIIGIIGDRGDGKTTIETIMLKKAHDAGFNVFSNYWLSFIDEDHYITFEEMSRLPEYLKDGFVGMDEIQIALDSRESLSSNNKSLTTLVTQIRKRGLTLIYTTQRMGMADLRLRQQTDILIFPSKVKAFHKNGILIDSLYKVIVQEVKTGEIIKSYYIDAYDCYEGHWYNTDEIIDFAKKPKVKEVIKNDVGKTKKK